MAPTDINKSLAIANAYTEMRTQLFAIFRQVCMPEADCEDMVQEVFVRLLGVDTLQVETVNAIAATIAFRLRIDYLRRRAFMRRLYKEPPRAEIYEKAAAHSNDCELRELISIEQRAIERLLPENQRIYRLSRFQGKSNNEIAQIMAMSYRSVESRLYRSRMLVRQAVAKAM